MTPQEVSAQIASHHQMRIFALLVERMVEMARVANGGDVEDLAVRPPIPTRSPWKMLQAQWNWQSPWMRNGIRSAVGLGLGAYALAASLGVWIGLWDFRAGFNMLRFVNASADWAAWITLAVSIAVFVGTRKLAPQKTQRLTTLAAVGCVACALAYIVPETYRAPEGTPPIHDITTDTDNPPQFVAVAPLRANAPNSVIYGDQPNWDATRMAAAQKEVAHAQA